MIEFNQGMFTTAYEENQDRPEITQRIERLFTIAKLINSLNYVLFISKNRKAMLINPNLAEDMQIDDMVEVKEFDDFCIAMTQSTITNLNVGTYKMVEKIVEYLNSLTKNAKRDDEGNLMTMAKPIVHFDNT